MLLVYNLNKGKFPEKPQGGEPGPVPSLSSLTVKPQNIAARVPNVDRIKKAVHERLITALGGNSDTASTDMVQRRIGELVDEYCQETNLKLTKHDREELAELIINDTLGLGPLESLLDDPEVSEIMVNGPKTIFAERRGRLGQSDLVFEDERQLLTLRAMGCDRAQGYFIARPMAEDAVPEWFAKNARTPFSAA